MKQLEKEENYNNKNFENIKHIDENGIEFWYARELQVVLDYKEWRKFKNVIDKAEEACKNTGISEFEHFVDADKTIKMPKGATKKIKDYKLTRYACYLIAQNGDPRKKVISLAQTYKETIHLIKQQKMQELKILIDFIIMDIKVCIMERLLMILLKERD